VRYLLDSDVVIDHLKNVRLISDLIGDLEEHDAFLNMVTYMEVYQGIYRDPEPHLAEAQFLELLDSVGIALFTAAVARRCAMLREDLKRSGRRVRHRLLDLITAATAIENDLILVTRNTPDYGNIPGLRLHT
jgi:tRNA(fMet)-specific endonuclease VapC